MSRDEYWVGKEKQYAVPNRYIIHLKIMKSKIERYFEFMDSINEQISRANLYNNSKRNVWYTQ